MVFGAARERCEYLLEIGGAKTGGTAAMVSQRSSTVRTAAFLSSVELQPRSRRGREPPLQRHHRLPERMVAPHGWRLVMPKIEPAEFVAIWNRAAATADRAADRADPGTGNKLNHGRGTSGERR